MAATSPPLEMVLVPEDQGLERNLSHCAGLIDSLQTLITVSLGAEGHWLVVKATSLMFNLCLSYYSINVKRLHDQGNLGKRVLIGGLMVLEGESVTVMEGAQQRGGHVGCWSSS